jgi:hypothetical protein
MAEINTTQLRDALAWATSDNQKAQEPSTNPFVWFWEAIEGDFNEDRSTAQILVDAGISMIPLVDQVCDVRDLVANCRKLSKDYKDTWAWVALVLSLIGLFPSLGSLVKGVLKIFFGFIRRSGGNTIIKAVDGAMTWVITFIRRPKVQKYLQSKRIDEVFKYLELEVKAAKARINVKALLTAFDRALHVVEGLVNKVTMIPIVGRKAKSTLEEMRRIRTLADAHIGAAIKPVQDILDTIVLRLEREAMEKQHGIVDVANIHYRGVLPEAAAVALMRKRKPKFLTVGDAPKFEQLKPSVERAQVNRLSARTNASGGRRAHKDIFPELSDQNIRSFHTLNPHTINGPARLYRILAPSSRGMSDCWVSEKVFKELQSAPDPKEAWRKYLAVWPDWNVDGQFVIYDVKAGESLNVWRGIASSQTRKSLPGYQLEGGAEQIVFKVSRKDIRNDSMLYYKMKGGTSGKLGPPLTQQEVDQLTAKMNPMQKQAFYDSHLAVRENLNHPNISGPFDTGWGYTEFDGAGTAAKIGLPALPGQLTVSR